MLVAVCDQSTGVSTSRCSKMIAPLSLPMAAVRVSHWTSSYGVFPGSRREVKNRGKAIPVFDFVVTGVFNASIFALKSTEIWPMASLYLRSVSSYRLRNIAPIYRCSSRILSICRVLVLQEQRPKDYHTARIGGWESQISGWEAWREKEPTGT